MPALVDPTCTAFDALDLALLNNWQRDFPLTSRPFELMARTHQTSSHQILARLQSLQQSGALSRIGGIFGVGAGGSAMLCALAVPPTQLTRVAQWVNAHDYVNHNYAREHIWNLWFVVTAPSVSERDACIDQIEQQCGLRALRLPMRRAFRIDLGFDLHTGQCQANTHRRCEPVASGDIALAAAVESGLPLVEHPYEQWARATGRSEHDVLAQLQQWLDKGTLRRLGAIVRHHELGVTANAMTVFDVPDDELAERGRALASQPGITLCYARQRDEGWHYNLYCMVHGRTQTDTRLHIERARQQAGLQHADHAVLFSTQRFKQTGGRYFRLASPAVKVAA